MPSGFQNYPYAPRSTQQTLDSHAFRRYPVPAGTGPLPCRFCGQAVYRVLLEDAYVTEAGSEVGATYRVLDASPDVAGVEPTAREGGSGIDHTLLCEIPRPLPAQTPERMATSTANFRTPKARKAT